MMRLTALTVAVCAWVSVLVVPAQAEIQINEVTSPGGITAWLVEDHSIPFTALELRFRGGTSLDAPGKRGATYLMAGLLEEGSGEMGAQDYARAVEIWQPALVTMLTVTACRSQRDSSAKTAGKPWRCCTRRCMSRVSTRMHWTGCGRRSLPGCVLI